MLRRGESPWQTYQNPGVRPNGCQASVSAACDFGSSKRVAESTASRPPARQRGTPFRDRTASAVLRSGPVPMARLGANTSSGHDEPCQATDNNTPINNTPILVIDRHIPERYPICVSGGERRSAQDIRRKCAPVGCPTRVHIGVHPDRRKPRDPQTTPSFSGCVCV